MTNQNCHIIYPTAVGFLTSPKEETMTMPHLMNCAHSPDSWCLDCVRKEHDELTKRAEDAENEACMAIGHIEELESRLYACELAANAFDDGDATREQLIETIVRQADIQPFGPDCCRDCFRKLNHVERKRKRGVCADCDRKAFIEHLEQSQEIVSRWPEWRRMILGGQQRTKQEPKQ